jgi:hypothetical protein
MHPKSVPACALIAALASMRLFWAEPNASSARLGIRAVLERSIARRAPLAHMPVVREANTVFLVQRGE